jgi:hypothetical protein
VTRDVPDPGQRRHHPPPHPEQQHRRPRVHVHRSPRRAPHPGDKWRPLPDQPPRTVTDIHRHHGVITLTDQYGSTWTYPATSVIPTAVPDPLHIHTSTTANGGTR